MSIYLSFISYAQRPDGMFHNYMGYDRRFMDEVGSDDCYGRALWGLGYHDVPRAHRLPAVQQGTLRAGAGQPEGR